jgi:hypothetical protein
MLYLTVQKFLNSKKLPRSQHIHERHKVQNLCHYHGKDYKTNNHSYYSVKPKIPLQQMATTQATFAYFTDIYIY